MNNSIIFLIFFVEKVLILSGLTFLSGPTVFNNKNF